MPDLSNELKLLRNAPLQFLKKYWVSPSSQYSQFQLPDSTNPAFYSRGNAFQGQKGQVDAQVTISQLEHKVAYSNLVPTGGDSYALHCYNTNQLTAHKSKSYCRSGICHGGKIASPR
jgi:hypothetical protein